MAGAGAVDVELVVRTERWFLRRGLPHLIEGYRATEDVFTRMVPVLLLIGLLESVNAVKAEWAWWQNLLALLGGAALLVGAYVGINVVRGRGPFQRPDTIGPLELALFVVLPPLVPLVFGDVGIAVLTALTNLVLLGLVSFTTSFGLVSMTRWALGRTVAAVETIAALVGRALPVLFAVTILVFVNTEAWQVAAALSGWMFVLTGAMFVVVGLFFLVTRLPGEVKRVDDAFDAAHLAEVCAGTPVAARAAEVRSGVRPLPPVPPELSRRQRLNVYLVFLFAQAVQAALVTAAVFAFFAAFGMIAIRPVVIEGWLGPDIPDDVLVSFGLFGQEVQVTRALLKVSGFVAFVAGFSFTVSLVTDAGYREEFFDDVIGEVRQALAVRKVYLSLRSAALVPPDPG